LEFEQFLALAYPTLYVDKTIDTNTLIYLDINAIRCYKGQSKELYAYFMKIPVSQSSPSVTLSAHSLD